MKHFLILLLVISLLLCSCGTRIPAESIPDSSHIRETVPEESSSTIPVTQPVPPQIPADLLHLVDYSLILAALEEMGCKNTVWDVVDVEFDGYPELIAETFSSTSGFPSQILVDGGTGSTESFTATGAAQSARFCIDEQGRFGLLSGYYSAVGNQEFFYLWSGQHWTQVPVATDPYGNPLPEEHFYQPVSLRCPDLRVQTSPADAAATAAYLDAAFLSRGMQPEYVTLDFDGDGTDEHLFLITGATNLFFRQVAGTSFWGDELHLEYRDSQVSAVVVSTLAGRTWVRTTRLGDEATVELTVSGEGIAIDERSYVYQSDGIPFVPSP